MKTKSDDKVPYFVLKIGTNVELIAINNFIKIRQH